MAVLFTYVAHDLLKISCTSCADLFRVIQVLSDIVAHRLFHDFILWLAYLGRSWSPIVLACILVRTICGLWRLKIYAYFPNVEEFVAVKLGIMFVVQLRLKSTDRQLLHLSTTRLVRPRLQIISQRRQQLGSWRVDTITRLLTQLAHTIWLWAILLSVNVFLERIMNWVIFLWNVWEYKIGLQSLGGDLLPVEVSSFFIWRHGRAMLLTFLRMLTTKSLRMPSSSLICVYCLRFAKKLLIIGSNWRPLSFDSGIGAGLSIILHQLDAFKWRCLFRYGLLGEVRSGPFARYHEVLRRLQTSVLALSLFWSLIVWLD